MRKRTLGVVLLAGLAVSGAGAFTASNTVPTSAAGVGSGAVSGVTVNDIDYTVAQSVAGVDQVSVVTFTAASSLDGKEVIVRLEGASGTLATADTLGTVGNGVCTVSNVTPTVTTCTWATGRADLVDVTSLEVVAYDND